MKNSSVTYKKQDGRPIAFKFEFENGLPVKEVLTPSYSINKNVKDGSYSIYLYLDEKLINIESIKINNVSVESKEVLVWLHLDDCYIVISELNDIILKEIENKQIKFILFNSEKTNKSTYVVMTKINFLDTKKTINLRNLNVKSQEIPIDLNDDKEVKFSKNLLTKFINLNLNLKWSKNLIEKLELHILNSLEFQSSISAYSDELPEEIKIKFTKTKIRELINPYYQDGLAQTDIENNVIYISSSLLSNKNNQPFLKELQTHVKDQQEFLDIIFYHEFAHVLFTHRFKSVINLSDQLKTQSNTIDEIPLYQLIRTIEENFSDTYACLLNYEKNKNIPFDDYVKIRNSSILGRTVGFYLNINELSDSFLENKSLDIKDSFDNIYLKIFHNTVKGIWKKSQEISIQDSIYKTNLEQNFSSFGLTATSENFLKLLTSNENKHILMQSKDIKNRMISMRNQMNNLGKIKSII